MLYFTTVVVIFAINLELSQFSLKNSKIYCRKFFQYTYSYQFSLIIVYNFLSEPYWFNSCLIAEHICNHDLSVMLDNVRMD